MYVPTDVPDRCPACDCPYESVSRHTGGFSVNLLDNERYQRVCFYPTSDEEESPALDCYHHTHAEAGVNGSAGRGVDGGDTPSAER